MMDSDNLWVVGLYRCEGKEGGAAWELNGVFDDEELAISMCRTPNHFIGPIVLNVDRGDETIIWPGYWYPQAETKEESRS